MASIPLSQLSLSLTVAGWGRRGVFEKVDDSVIFDLISLFFSRFFVTV